MSHVTITTTIGQGNESGQPRTDVLTTDSNHKDDLNTHRNIDSSHGANDLQTNTHNVNLTNDLHANRNQDLDKNTHISSTNYPNNQNTQDVHVNRSHDYDKNTHNVNLTNVLPQTHTSSQQHQDVNVGKHGQSHEYENLHGKGKDITSPLLATNNVGTTNQIRNDTSKDIEIDSNRKDNWVTPNNVKNVGVKDTDHHRHNNDVLITSNDENLKKDHGHQEHHILHDSNKTNTHNHPIITNDNINKSSNDHASTTVIDNDLRKRNITYDTNPSFANDVGTTGLLGNNLGNNLVQDAGPDRLVPTGINKNADWTGHVPDSNHPKSDDLKHMQNDNKKL